MNRQDICSGHYSEPRAPRTSRGPILLVREVRAVRELIVRLIMGELHRAGGSHA